MCRILSFFGGVGVGSGVTCFNKIFFASTTLYLKEYKIQWYIWQLTLYKYVHTCKWRLYLVMEVTAYCLQVLVANVQTLVKAEILKADFF